ncbi:MAG: single-stranded DNA-binding protein [Candidatus Babeliales bacterium]|nr:single-stranded DNA-binding protein [Candidatus Babeliales bacterium]
MAGYNRIIIVGNLTRDPEYKQLTSGQGICRLAIASNRQYKNKQTGSLVQEVCYVDVDVWGAQAESCRQYLQKGKAALIEGRLKFDTWEQDGQKRSKHIIVADRVVFLSSASAMDVESDQLEEKIEPRNQVERDILNQLDDLKSRGSDSMAATGPKKARKSTSDFGSDIMSTGEVNFKDEPPFQDDLPF